MKRIYTPNFFHHSLFYDLGLTMDVPDGGLTDPFVLMTHQLGERSIVELGWWKPATDFGTLEIAPVVASKIPAANLVFQVTNAAIFKTMHMQGLPWLEPDFGTVE